MVHIIQNNSILVVAAILLIGLLAGITPVAAQQSWFDVSSTPSGAWTCLDGWNCDNTPITFAVTPSRVTTGSAYTWMVTRCGATT
jgi:hypothetical protein